MKLFIGGVNDGKWLDLPDLPVLVLALPPVACPDLSAEPVSPMKSPDVERYRATRWCAGDQDFTIYVIEGMPLAEAFSRLLRHYKPVRPPASEYLEEDSPRPAQGPTVDPSASHSSPCPPSPSSEDSPEARSES